VQQVQLQVLVSVVETACAKQSVGFL
jgi:hypothetical protein